MKTKTTILTGVALATVMASQATPADCGGYTYQLTQSDIMNAFLGQTISTGDDNEDHCGGARLFKHGANTTVDPQALRGSWDVDGSGLITYTYNVTGHAVYSYYVWGDAGAAPTPRVFCDGSGAVVATIAAVSPASCP